MAFGLAKRDLYGKYPPSPASASGSEYLLPLPSGWSAPVRPPSDLCRVTCRQIRKQAIKDLPQLCRENRTFLPKIADVLAQLLQSEDTTEVKEVHSSLTVLFKIDAKGGWRVIGRRARRNAA